MTDEEQQSVEAETEAVSAAEAEEVSSAEAEEGIVPGPRPLGPLEEELDVYPIRPPEHDPRWALWVMWTWVGIAIFFIVFILVLIVLGFYYD